MDKMYKLKEDPFWVAKVIFNGGKERETDIFKTPHTTLNTLFHWLRRGQEFKGHLYTTDTEGKEVRCGYIFFNEHKQRRTEVFVYVKREGYYYEYWW